MMLWPRCKVLRRALLACLLVPLFCGCPRSILLRSQDLGPGMTKEQVAQLFAHHEVLHSGHTQADLTFATKKFQTNVVCAYWVTYLPRRRLFTHNAESCRVFFDDKGTIIGYRFERPD